MHTRMERARNQTGDPVECKQHVAPLVKNRPGMQHFTCRRLDNSTGMSHEFLVHNLLGGLDLLMSITQGLAAAIFSSVAEAKGGGEARD